MIYKNLKIILLILFFFTLNSLAQKSNEVETVENINLQRYQGKWYEIAKIPNSFQKKCESNTTANYELINDERISVVNRCFNKEEEVVKAEGVARVVDSVSNAKLKVSFFNIFGWYLFWGDYWIIGIGDDYEYSIVGHPKRKYGWILSREKTLPDDKLNEAFSKLRISGYDSENFEFTKQE